MRNDSVQAQESIKVLNAMLSTHQWEPVRRELEFAINELKKCIPTKPFRENGHQTVAQIAMQTLAVNATMGITKIHITSFVQNAGRS